MGNLLLWAAATQGAAAGVSLAGVINGVSSTTLSLTVAKRVSGVINGASSATLTLTTAKSIAGTINGVSSTTCNITVSAVSISGTISGVSSATLSLTTTIITIKENQNMTTQNKEIVLGDVVKWEQAHEYCRSSLVISRDLTASDGLAVGELLEPDTAVAQIHTTTNTGGAPTADGGTYRLGYKGQWTTDLAFGVTLGDAKIAFELLSTVTDTVTFSASPAITGTTCTWATAGPKEEIQWDTRLLLDGTVVCGTLSPVSTIGSLVASQVIIATGSNATSILLEKVTVAELNAGNDIERACIVRGAAIVASDHVTVLAAQKAAALTALTALGVQFRTDVVISQSGPPTS